MGEVYRARDTRLDRSVAIKVLPSGFANDPQLRERFEREARAISSLSHPNICALHDIGRDGDDAYLVMELLEGETLADRVARGPLPVSQVARYGAQIADALQHAHRAGIAHRDLKPGNIMITGAGAKLLDFGLAKFADAATRVYSEHSAPQTAIHALTAEGIIVGTFQYLAPEQLEGRAVDHRADIFALGLVLYEMATGRRPFAGDSRTALITAILTTDPIPPRSMQPAIPAALERIILTALEKKPEDRWQTAHDVARQLQWLGDSSTGTTVLAPPPAQRRVVSTALLVAGSAIAASLLTWIVLRQAPADSGQGLRLRAQISLPADREPVLAGDGNTMALSPDGQMLVFLAGSPRALYLRRLDSEDLTKVEGTEMAYGPFWSSDGKWIGFSARGKLWKTRNTKGATPEAICDVAVSGAIATWQGDTILLADAPDGRNGIFRVSASTGKVTPAIQKTAKEWRQSWPLLLPDGKRFLYLSFASDSIERSLVLAELDSPRRSVLTTNISHARRVGADQLVFVRDGSLMSQRFDVERGVLTGDVVPLAESVNYFYANGQGSFDASPNGVVVYQTDTRTRRLSVVTHQGIETGLLDDESGLFDVTVSRDGTKAAATIMRKGTRMGDIWLYDLARGVRDRFTSEPGMEVSPAFTPDGRTLVYSNTQGGATPFLVQRPVAGGTTEQLSKPGLFLMAGTFSASGDALFVTGRDPVTRRDLFRFVMKTKELKPFFASPFSDTLPVASPDGRWLAYVSDATGIEEVYLQSLEREDSPRIRISSNGGRMAQWREDSGELFYLSTDGRLVSVVPGSGGRWEAATLNELFRRPGLLGFATVPHSQSFLLLEGANGPGASLFYLITGVH